MGSQGRPSVKRAALVSRRSSTRPAGDPADFVKLQMLELAETIEAAAVAIRAVDLDAEDPEQQLQVWVHLLSTTAMRVATLGEALTVRAKIKALQMDLRVLAVAADDDDDVGARVMRPLLDEARRGLAGVGA